MNIKYFENDSMIKLEEAIKNALNDLNISIHESISEGFPDSKQAVEKPQALYNALLEAFKEMVRIDQDEIKAYEDHLK